VSYGTEDHKHNAYDVYGVADEHHRHYDDESAVRGLREDLSHAEERIRELENDIRRLWTHIGNSGLHVGQDKAAQVQAYLRGK